MIKYEWVGWSVDNEDNVIILVKLPHGPLTPDSLFDDKTLMLYGRRTGKLRAKLIPWIDNNTVMIEAKIQKHYETVSMKHRKLKHLLPQIEKHLSWALLAV